MYRLSPYSNGCHGRNLFITCIYLCGPFSDQREEKIREERPPMPTTGRPITSDFSYNAMLQSYARKVDRPIFSNHGKISEEDNSFENIEPGDLKEGTLQMAQDMNFEVVNVDDYISTGTKNVR